jgi:hypothetical protein
MADLTVEISGFVSGDNLGFRRTVTDLPNAIETAWLTVKRYEEELDASAQFQKLITVTNAPGTGQVEAPGGSGSNGTLRFDLTPAETAALGSLIWVFDIQVQLDGDSIYTVEKGTIQLTRGVTDATVEPGP